MARLGDLFDWRDETEAARAAVAAEDARREAARRLRLAGPGQITDRRQALAAATNTALRAEVQLTRIRRELGMRQ